ncbi:MAG: hypothetical protein DCF13_13475 [Flavobacteriaceae bacterium]|nr:MAG: hypothetical protein DCF13_13475 [Flavobacteriaceae bacterium]
MTSISIVFSQPKNDKFKVLDLLAKSKKAYETKKNLVIKTTYNFYNSFSSKKPSETYFGLFLKGDGEYYSKIGSTELINLKDCNIVIDNELKKIVSNSPIDNSSIDKSYDLTSFCNNFSMFSLSSTNDNWICTMTAPEITFVPYSKIIVYINKSTHLISKQVMYYLNAIKYKDSKGKIKQDFPKIIIDFRSHSFELGGEKDRLKKGYYLNTNKGQITPSNKYIGYKLIDNF